MRLGPPMLGRSCRLPWNEDMINRTPFKELFPLKLANKIHRHSDKTADVSCLQEMAVMFACMKANEFKEVKCGEEVATFQKCYKDHTATKKARKKFEQSGQIITGTNTRVMTIRQVNDILKKYPQQNKD